MQNCLVNFGEIIFISKDKKNLLKYSCNNSLLEIHLCEMAIKLENS